MRALRLIILLAFSITLLISCNKNNISRSTNTNNTALEILTSDKKGNLGETSDNSSTGSAAQIISTLSESEIIKEEHKEHEKKFSIEAEKYRKPLSIEDATEIFNKVIPLLENEFIEYESTTDKGNYVFKHSQVIGDNESNKYSTVLERYEVNPKKGEYFYIDPMFFTRY